MKNILTIFLVLTSFKGFSQHPIFATIPGGDLYSFDLINCTRRFIGSTNQQFGDIAFTPDGQLWGITSGNLYHVDTTTAVAILIGNMGGIGGVSLVGLNDTTLLVESGKKLYGVNTNTAASYYIDSIGHTADGDLTWYDDDLYMVTSGGMLIKIVLNSTNTPFVSVTAVNNLSNLIPGCEGAVTASFAADYNSIVGFNGPNLYKICQIDGSYELLCPALNLGGTPGAASCRLVTQVPQPTVCHMTNSVSNLTTVDSKFKLSPNPFSNQLTFSSVDNEQTTLTLSNFLGQQILQHSFTNLTSINTAQLADGIYFYKLRNEKGVVKSGKVVKQ